MTLWKVNKALLCFILGGDFHDFITFSRILFLVDRYMVGTVRNVSLNKREVKWFHTRSASAPVGQGRGGTISKPSLFDIDGHRLVWRGYLNNYDMNVHDNNIRSPACSTVLVMGSIPPLNRGYVLSLLKNNDPISISITPESLDIKGR